MTLNLGIGTSLLFATHLLGQVHKPVKYYQKPSASSKDTELSQIDKHVKYYQNPSTGSKVIEWKGISPADLLTLGVTLTLGIGTSLLFLTHLLGQIHKPVKYYQNPSTGSKVIQRKGIYPADL